MNDTIKASGLFSDSTGAAVLRLIVYAFCLYAITASVPTLIEGRAPSLFRENGPIEWIQFSVLSVVALAFLASSLRISSFRHLLFLLASFALVAAVRELDELLASLFPLTGRFFVLAPLLFAAWWGYAMRAALKDQISGFVTTRSCGILWTAFLVIVPIAKMTEHGFFKLMMGKDYDRIYKHSVEETLELTGGLILLVGCLECIVQLRSRDDASTVAAPREQKSEG